MPPSDEVSNNGSENGKKNPKDYRAGADEGEEPKLEAVTTKIVSEHLIRYVTYLRPGLGRFYQEDKIKEDTDFVVKATEFLNKIRTYFKSYEKLIPMSVIVLYDIVMLVDNSLSMVIEQDGQRKDTLKATIENVARVCFNTRPSDAKHIDLRSLNGTNDYKELTPKKLNSFLKTLQFEGLTPIGTVLKQKILEDYVIQEMKKPLLVIITTDGAIEGEPHDRLKKVITETALKIIKSQKDNTNKAAAKHAAQAVSYQFAKIGNDPKASDMVQGLDNDTILAPYIDCLLQSRLEDLQSEDVEKKWDVVSFFED
ncbi:hypothetical protein EDC01DRAFT_660351 [Geopyxis carbonaria]|nr:hypothetical protein EDC01DRAFT_660351 [Geopyxis carbonaria]